MTATSVLLQLYVSCFVRVLASMHELAATAMHGGMASRARIRVSLRSLSVIQAAFHELIIHFSTSSRITMVRSIISGGKMNNPDAAEMARVTDIVDVVGVSAASLRKPRVGG